jgi:hypothetical protein
MTHSYYIPNAPTQVRMDQFLSISSQYGGLGKACRFLAVINPVGRLVPSFTNGYSYGNTTRDLMYLCESTEFPGRTIESVEVRYHGNSYDIPIRGAKYDPVQMTFITRASSIERAFFDQWVNNINPIDTYNANYRDDVRADISIYNISEINGEFASCVFTLQNAFPSQVSPQAVTWADAEVLRLGVSFSYEFWYKYGQQYNY